MTLFYAMCENFGSYYIFIDCERVDFFWISGLMAIVRNGLADRATKSAVLKPAAYVRICFDDDLKAHLRAIFGAGMTLYMTHCGRK